MAVLDVPALRYALEKSGVRAELIPQTITQLTLPPISLRVSASDYPEIESAIKSRVKFDRNLAARMFRLNAGRPDPEVTWTKLTPLERKRAKRLWHWAVYGPDSLTTGMQSRPPKIDSSLVLYCMRVICEASGQSRFKFRRPEGGGPPGGPMWRALAEVLPEFKRDSIAEIVTTVPISRFRPGVARYLSKSCDIPSCDSTRTSITAAKATVVTSHIFSNSLSWGTPWRGISCHAAQAVTQAESTNVRSDTKR